MAVIGFRCIVERAVEEYLISTSALQGVIRLSLVEGPAKLWLEEMLPRHFEGSAFYRYQYAPRSQKWQNIKRRGSKRLGIPPMEPPLPLVWTGAANQPGSLRAAVLGGVQSGDLLGRARGIARGQRIELRIRVPTPHPLNPRNAGELTRVDAGEKRRLDQRARAKLNEKLRTYPRRVRIREDVSAAAAVAA